ncbi:UDP-glucose 4-epimerase family protein [Marinobacterium lutimaris]|uniref:Nucleoside-diphosphate-sugar epimerase n=1 Tax=Marinobacterium lutimaris TaxID=568106 RepID=A0A1H6B8G4_9GAMM|nr:SDR family oxidoreductase [Marinobacterium lutimaris]SEG57113.1 Nucleoside-diphosphate-sugar epimerase [Marinobacterium lutimaris]
MKERLHVLVTGASGFLGQALLQQLVGHSEFQVQAVQRSAQRNDAVPLHIVPVHIVGDFGAAPDFSGTLCGQQVVIHTAARAQIMNDQLADPLAEYRRVNVDGTLNLARQAAWAGVKRFIFISSIKVNGEQTSQVKPFTAEDLPSPQDPYGQSKLEAEQGLQQLAAETGMELVIIRPPLVYGPGVKGNFASLIRLVRKGRPLPLGAIHNQRSLVALDNLVDLIITCIDHPAAANQIFLAGDGEDLSTTDLLRRLSRAMSRQLWILPVPAFLLRLGAALLGKQAMADRLLGSLRVDISKARELLGWEPPITVEEGLRRCFDEQVNDIVRGDGAAPTGRPE